MLLLLLQLVAAAVTAVVAATVVAVVAVVAPIVVAVVAFVAAVVVFFSCQKRPFLRVLNKTHVTMLTSATKRFRWSFFQLKRS